MSQGRKAYHNTSNQMTAGAFFSVPPNLPLKFCSLYQNPQIRVEEIRRPLWLCVNYFKKWLHVPLIKCSLKPIRLQGAQKQTLFEEETQKNMQHKQRKISYVSVHAAHMCWVELFFIQIVWILHFPMLQNKACCLLLFAIALSFSMMPLWRVFVTEATRLRKWYGLTFNAILTK